MHEFAILEEAVVAFVVSPEEYIHFTHARLRIQTKASQLGFELLLDAMSSALFIKYTECIH